MMQERVLVFCTAQSINSGDYSNIVRQQANNEYHYRKTKRQQITLLHFEFVYFFFFHLLSTTFPPFPTLLQAVDSISIFSGKRAVHC